MVYAPSKSLRFDEIPIVDLGIVRSDPDGLAKVADHICEASSTAGFFYVTGHGVSETLVTDTIAAAQRFFALPRDVKAQVAVNRLHRGYIGFGAAKMEGSNHTDLKESFVYGLECPSVGVDTRRSRLVGPNQWPAVVPELRTAVYSLFEAMMDCGRTVLSAVACGLGLEPQHFDAAFAQPLARGSVIHYPPQPEQLGTDQFGVAPHTDYGFLTLLWQDAVGGLEVLNHDGDWVQATPIPGTFVVNVGDLLARWSNERFASNAHRVVNRAGTERFSIPLFFDPAYDTVIDARDANIAPGTKVIHEPVVAGDYVAERFDAAFSYRSTSV